MSAYRSFVNLVNAFVYSNIFVSYSSHENVRSSCSRLVIYQISLYHYICLYPTNTYDLWIKVCIYCITCTGERVEAAIHFYTSKNKFPFWKKISVQVRIHQLVKSQIRPGKGNSPLFLLICTIH